MSKISSITERVSVTSRGLYLEPKEPIKESVQKLLGKPFLYRYHRPNHVYKGRVISIVDNQRIVVVDHTLSESFKENWDLNNSHLSFLFSKLIT